MSDRSDDDDIDDASLKSMRAVWLSMRDEDPPAAGMSALMAAAAQKADQMRGQRETWWQRLVAQLRRPPALAFATVMLLIGGAVLVTRSQNEKVAALTAEDRPAPREQSAPVATPTTGIAPADPVPEREQADGMKQPDAPTDSRGKLEKDRPKAKKPAVVKDDDVGKNEPDRDHRFDADVDVKPGFAGGKANVEDKTVLETPAHGSPGPATTQPPPKTPEPAPSAGEAETVTRGNAGTATDTRKSEPRPPATATSKSPTMAASNEQLAKRAEELAARGDCAAAREVVAQLRRNDEAFYRQRLGKNATVAKCF